jgi:hypothetical protein
LAILFLGDATSGATESPVDLYNAAIKNMAALPEPPYVVYRLEGKPASAIRPLQVKLRVNDKLVWLDGDASNANTTWFVVHRTSDFTSAILDENKHQYVSNRSFFDPTWYGAYHALHDGMFFLYPFFSDHQPKPQPIPTPEPSITGGPKTITSVTVPAPGLYKVQGTGSTTRSAVASGRQMPSPAPAPIQTPLASNLKTIAFINVMGPGIYNIQDRGAAGCSNGDPARALHLTARTSPEKHQLSDVLIDLNFMRFCMVRFIAPGNAQRIVEFHYAMVAGFWMQTDGVVAVTWRERVLPDLGPREPGMVVLREKPELERRYWIYQLVIISYPTTVPDSVFDAP